MLSFAGMGTRVRYLPLAAAVSLSLSFGTVASAQTAPSPKAVKAYEAHSRKVLWKIGQRNVNLGLWARKIGLNAQATEQFLRVKEVSDGVNIGGDFLLGLQRQYGDKFWKRHLKRPPRRLLREYDKRARAIALKGRKDRFALAHYARKRKLTAFAKKQYEALLRSSDGEIAFDEKGRIPLEGGTIPADYAERFESEAIEIDGKLQLRDEFLAEIREVKEVFVADSAVLRVRSQISRKQAVKLHAMLSALLPKLEDATGGIPTRKLDVFVFAKNTQFRAYLKKAGYGDAKVHGLMDPRAFCALVCAEKRAPAVVQAIAMHELTHLYDYAVSRAVFPMWYTEGFAETYGGIGTFAFEEGKLEVGGEMQAYRIKPLLADRGLVPLRDMLAMDSAELLTADIEVAARFYAQSWAFLRYLRTGAGQAVANRLAIWEARCRGAAVGAEVGKPRARNQAESTKLFEAAFAGELFRLETGFRKWLESLVAR